MTNDAYKARALSDPAVIRLMEARLALKATRAREDVVDFFEFVIREQVTRRPIKVAPHQRVMLDFVMAHDRSVCVMPIGTSKTFTAAGLTLKLLGDDPTSRGAIVSAAEDRAAKTVGVVSDYVTNSAELRLVYPHLRPSQRKRDSWTQTAITVDRPPGIPDPSLVAVGFEGAKIVGARLNWIVIDDLLNHENTNTPEQRKKVLEWLDSTVLRRLDPKGGRVVVINTAWHMDDLVHKLEKAGWATLRMDIYGGIQVQDDLGTARARQRLGLPWRAWDHPELRPATRDPGETFYRLRSHDPDPKNEIPLWPERYPIEWVEEEKRKMQLTSGIAEFNRAYMGQCRDDASAMCKAEWIEKCKAASRAAGHHGFVHRLRSPNLIVTGVDLAFRQGQTADKTCIFTVECLPSGHRRILEIQLGQWSAPEIITRLISVNERYQSVIRVEDNGAQLAIVQMLRARDVSIPLKSHTTGMNKSHHQYGVQGVFIDMENGAWLIPNDGRGEVHPAVAQWIQGCLYYSPNQHADDALMASWLAREQAREWGALSPPRGDGGGRGGQSISANIMAR